MKIRELQPLTKQEIARQHEALERQLEQKRIERLERRLATKLTPYSQGPAPRVA
jgi:hypothetical protein